MYLVYRRIAFIIQESADILIQHDISCPLGLKTVDSGTS